MILKEVRMNPARFRWGILFILAGVLLILHNFRLMDWWAWEKILSLWPLILIAIGVEKIFARTKIQFISYLAPVALAAIVIFVAVNGNLDDNFRRIGNTYRYNLEMKPGYKSLTLDFALDDKDLSVGGAKDGDLVRCRFGSNGSDPDVRVEENDGDVNLRFEEDDHTVVWFGTRSYHRFSNRWSARINNSIPMNLNCSGDKSDMRIDGRDLDIRKLKIDSDDGDINLSIGSLAESVKVILRGDEADFTMLVPKNAGIKVVGADESLNRRFEKIGFIESPDGYISEGYDSLSPKIELDMSGDISQFSLDFY